MKGRKIKGKKEEVYQIAGLNLHIFYHKQIKNKK